MQLTHSPRYKLAIISMAFLAVFGAIGFGRFGYSAVLRSMQKALGLSGGASGSLASWNFAGYTLMATIGSLLAARFGPRRVVSIGLVGAAAGMLVTGLSNGLASASAGRMLTGMGSGMVLVPCLALISMWFGERRRGTASAIVASGPCLALVLVGPIVPRLIAGGGADGWRIAWYFFAAVTTLMAVLASIVLRDRPHDPSAAEGEPSPVGRWAGSLDLKEILRSRYAWHLGTVYMLYGFAFMIFFTFFQKRLIADLGFSSDAAGNLFLNVGVAGLAGGVIVGMFSDRIGRGRAIAVACLLDALAAFLFTFWPSLPVLVIASAIFGVSAFGIPGLVGAACGDKFGAVLATASLGFVTIFIGVGQGVGPYVAGRMEDAFSSLGPSYLLSAGLFVAAALSALFLRRGSPAQSVAECD